MVGIELSALAIADLNHMLSDEPLREAILKDEEKKLHKSWKVQKDGSLLLGQTSFPRWVNRLLGGDRLMSFDELTIKIIIYMKGHPTTSNKEVVQAMAQDWAKERFGTSNKNEIIEMLFAFHRFGSKTGLLEDNPNAFESWINRPTRMNEKVTVVPGIALKDGLGIGLSFPQGINVRVL